MDKVIRRRILKTHPQGISRFRYRLRINRCLFQFRNNPFRFPEQASLLFTGHGGLITLVGTLQVHGQGHQIQDDEEYPGLFGKVLEYLFPKILRLLQVLQHSLRTLLRPVPGLYRSQVHLDNAGIIIRR